ncbi:hypothetical protein B0H10DRAFT_1953716 [Mycena sp. CBHHK59/15]|nr:hypothetical protein B0H10DRAFT_1953716 [Mycena sp. CBHHK59/15]
MKNPQSLQHGPPIPPACECQGFMQANPFEFAERPPISTGCECRFWRGVSVDFLLSNLFDLAEQLPIDTESVDFVPPNLFDFVDWTPIPTAISISCPQFCFILLSGLLSLQFYPLITTCLQEFALAEEPPFLIGQFWFGCSSMICVPNKL